MENILLLNNRKPFHFTFNRFNLQKSGVPTRSQFRMTKCFIQWHHKPVKICHMDATMCLRRNGLR